MSTCTTHDSNLFHFDHFAIAGLECDSIVGYWVIFFLAIGLQLARNRIWIKSSQLSREALQCEKNSLKRRKIVNQIIFYDILSYIGHIISFLLIVGANVGYWVAILIGNVSGTYYFMNRQDQDHQAENHLGKEMEEMSSLLKKYDSKTIRDDKELKQLREFRRNLLGFLRQSENDVQLQF